LSTTTAERDAPAFDRARLLPLLQEYGVYAALLVLLVVAVSLDGTFLSASNARVQLFQLAPTLLVALGMALVIGTEGIDLSVGAVIALSAAIVPLYLGYGLGVAIPLALLLGAASGLVAGAMVAFAGVQPIVATLSLMIGVRGLAELVNGSSAKPVTDPALLDLGENSLLGVPLMAWMPVRRVLVTVYVVSGVLSALAGILIVGHGAEADPANQGLSMELSAITAVVVGGTPLSGGRVRVAGTVAGALFMQLITAVLTQHNVPTSYTQLVEAAIICFAVYASRERGTR